MYPNCVVLQQNEEKLMNASSQFCHLNSVETQDHCSAGS
jgi:hypothetical protein